MSSYTRNSENINDQWRFTSCFPTPESTKVCLVPVVSHYKLKCTSLPFQMWSSSTGQTNERSSFVGQPAQHHWKIDKIVGF